MGVRSVGAVAACFAALWAGEAPRAQTYNLAPPAAPVKLIFIHHSTGEAWLSDDHGQLGLALRDSSYFVSDTNYGWGPSGIGDSTDIGNWWDWFSGPSRDTYTVALYAEYGQHSTYTRLAADPGGANRVVMFKSCFPNSHLGGSPSDPVPAIGDNPLRGQGCWSEDHTVANAKGIYLELLTYFAAHPETLFIVVAAPPLMAGATNPTAASNARAFNDWLTAQLLVGYPRHNVFVFDFYTVLTSDGGTTRIDNPNVNDLGWADGNHHRIASGALQHTRTVPHDYLAYWTGDSHPSAAGDLKATGEFVPLLNAAYHCWQGDGGCPRYPSAMPLRVPAQGVPLRATGSSGGQQVTVTWDASLCASSGYHLVWGYGSGLMAWDVEGGVCSLGVAGSANWSDVPDPGADPSRFLWFVVAGDDGLHTEGSWGLTSAGGERGGSAPSGVCGFTAKATGVTCGAS